MQVSKYYVGKNLGTELRVGIASAAKPTGIRVNKNSLNARIFLKCDFILLALWYLSLGSLQFSCSLPTKPIHLVHTYTQIMVKPPASEGPRYIQIYTYIKHIITFSVQGISLMGRSATRREQSHSSRNTPLVNSARRQLSPFPSNPHCSFQLPQLYYSKVKQKSPAGN